MKHYLQKIALTAIFVMTAFVSWAAITPSTPTKNSSGKYEIKTAAELLWFRDNMKGSTASFILMNDIYFNSSSACANYKNWTKGTSGINVWQNISTGNTDGNVFYGTFDGNGHTIYGLFIDYEENGDPYYNNGDDEDHYYGFIPNLGVGTTTGRIVNLTIRQSKYIVHYASVEICSKNHSAYCGIIAGGCSGQIENCKVIDCYIDNLASISYNDDYNSEIYYTNGFIAGVLYDNANTARVIPYIRNCIVGDEATGLNAVKNNSYDNLYPYMEANGYCSKAGGIVGKLSGNAVQLENCAFFGRIKAGGYVGGIVGENDKSYGFRTNIFAGVLIARNSSEYNYLGGIAGKYTSRPTKYSSYCLSAGIVRGAGSKDADDTKSNRGGLYGRLYTLANAVYRMPYKTANFATLKAVVGKYESDGKCEMEPIVSCEDYYGNGEYAYGNGYYMRVGVDTFPRVLETTYSTYTDKIYKLILKDMFNGAFSGQKTVYVNDNKNLNLPNPETTHKGYDFDGWYTAENGSGTKLVATAALPLPLPSDLAFYGYWKPKSVIIAAGTNLTTNIPTITYQYGTLSGTSNGSITTSGIKTFTSYYDKEYTFTIPATYGDNELYGVKISVFKRINLDKADMSNSFVYTDLSGNEQEMLPSLMDLTVAKVNVWNVFTKDGSNYKITSKISETSGPGYEFIFQPKGGYAINVACNNYNYGKVDAYYGSNDYSRHHKETTTEAISFQHDYLQKVVLVARPENGSAFIKWSDGNTDNPRVITIESAVELTAEFSPATYTIALISNSSSLYGSPVVTLTGNGTFTHGDNATVKSSIADDTHFTFDGWYNGSSRVSTLQEYAFTVGANATLTAKYAPVKYTVEVGNAFGMSKYSDDILVNGTQYGESEQFGYGTEVVVEAIPVEGYQFTKWSDDNTENPRTITILGNVDIKASYSEITATAIGDNLSSDNVVKVEYIGVSGVVTSAPQKGLNIIRTTYESGRITNEKRLFTK
ncbi:MAG: InlB B-repeat-containing protein [Bacteroidales bacterium]|nr:InlB B-repeat-containing protein [Bacteroidales bacterium]